MPFATFYGGLFDGRHTEVDQPHPELPATDPDTGQPTGEIYLLVTDDQGIPRTDAFGRLRYQHSALPSTG